MRKKDVPFISVTRNNLGLSQQRCDANYCWRSITSPVPALPAGTPHLAYETDVDQLCKSETDAGVIIVGAPASLQPDDQFSSISMQMRRNCDLFARMLVGRGGIRINATQVAGVKCVFLGGGSSQLQVTNATSRLVHSEAGGFASADFLLGPYGSGLTSYASKQAVADGTVMVAPAASDHSVYSSAAALAQEDDIPISPHISPYLLIFPHISRRRTACSRSCLGCSLAARTGRGAALAGDRAEMQPRLSRCQPVFSRDAAARRRDTPEVQPRFS